MATSVRLSAVYILGTGAVKYLLLGAALLLVPARGRAPAALHLVGHLQAPWTYIFSIGYLVIIWKHHVGALVEICKIPKLML